MYIEGCSEDLMYFFFFSFYFRYIISCILWSCDHFDIHCTYIPFILMYVFLFTYPYHVLFLLFLYTHVSYILCAIYYFCFTLRCHDEFCLKCFRNTGSQSLSCHKFSSCKVFLRVSVRIDFIVFNKWIWVEWFMTSLICSFVCCGFVMDCQRGRLLGHMWFTY